MSTMNPPAMAGLRAVPLKLFSFLRIPRLRTRGSRVAAPEDPPLQRAIPTDFVEPFELSFPARIRKFLWLSSGLFSAASFAMPALGILALGAVETKGLGANFLAGVVSAALFGLASLLRFGPEEA
jgi:hypothetical protein